MGGETPPATTSIQLQYSHSFDSVSALRWLDGAFAAEFFEECVGEGVVVGLGVVDLSGDTEHAGIVGAESPDGDDDAVAVDELVLEGVVVLGGAVKEVSRGLGEFDGGHGADHGFGGGGLDGEGVAEDSAAFDGESVVAGVELGPAAREEGAHGVDGGGESEDARVVVGAHVVEIAEEHGTFWADFVSAAGEADGAESLLSGLGDVEESGAFGGAEPLVSAADPEVGVHGGDVDRDLSRGVGAVDEDGDAALFAHGDQLADGEDEACGAGDPGDHNEASASGQARCDGVEDQLGAGDGEGDGGFDEGGAGAGADSFEFVDARHVLVVGDEDFVAWAEGGIQEDGGDGDGGVDHRGESGPRAAEECADFGAHVVHEEFEVVLIEPDGIEFHPSAEVGLIFRNNVRDGAVAAVVEEGERGIEAETGTSEGDRDWLMEVECAHGEEYRRVCEKGNTRASKS